ncbi:MAG: ribonuclease Y [Planctomycetota bacterium]
MDWIYAIVGVLAGAGVILVRNHLIGRSAAIEAEKVKEAAQKDASRAVAEAELKFKEESLKRKEAADKEAQEIREELKGLERRILKREDALDKKLEQMQRREKQLEQLETDYKAKIGEVEGQRTQIAQLLSQQKEQLHRISGMSRDQATTLLLEKLEREVAQENAEFIKRSVERARETAGEQARAIVVTALERCAAETSAERAVSSVDLPSDDMKGRIIGREGRNIRAFERSTGVDVIVDDTPGLVVVSAFDGVRREMARRSMEKLVADGRIHPARIEEVVEATKREMEDVVRELGRTTVQEMEIVDLHPKVTMLLGRLRYRASYGQNVLEHVKEVAHLAGSIAGELGLDVRMAKRCGLLHDIGKAVDQEMEGSHTVIGAELLKRFNERHEVVDTAMWHHETSKASSVYTVIATAADAISAARPGARRETLDKYIKRLEKLEEIANAFPGVDHAYAIQAGREVRVMANAHKMDDRQAQVTCREIAREIERELVYPGEIRVTMIRETRCVEYAR